MKLKNEMTLERLILTCFALHNDGLPINTITETHCVIMLSVNKDKIGYELILPINVMDAAQIAQEQLSLHGKCFMFEVEADEIAPFLEDDDQKLFGKIREAIKFALTQLPKRESRAN